MHAADAEVVEEHYWDGFVPVVVFEEEEEGCEGVVGEGFY